ncbi:hypothetical protein NDU88_006602 [Pleurodeles waltl]|uniref:Uncharacterized protein n=1 Tax=Pleurodeles waltl TaxID=8319 RepID=A0AAV7ULI2_PLEWA|nr:hypothetical protein NDU88_006602 [Pleurodeles waltl]
MEERAQSGAVHLPAREVTPMEVRSVESNARGLESRSYSRSAILTGEEEEELDYGEDGEQVEAPQASTSGQAFRGERLSRREVAANLSRGEGCVLGGTRSGFRVSKNVDVAIQAGGEGKESKVGDPMNAQEEAGCVGGPEGCCIVWIVGHSFVHWAEKQAAARHLGKQLGLDGSRIKERKVCDSSVIVEVIMVRSMFSENGRDLA